MNCEQYLDRPCMKTQHMRDSFENKYKFTVSKRNVVAVLFAFSSSFLFIPLWPGLAKLFLHIVEITTTHHIKTCFTNTRYTCISIYPIAIHSRFIYIYWKKLASKTNENSEITNREISKITHQPGIRLDVQKGMRQHTSAS